MLKRQLSLAIIYVALITLVLTGIVMVTRTLLPGRAEVPTPTPEVSPVLAGLTATVYKTQSCGCCKGYVEFLEKHGVTVEAIDTNKFMQIKADEGIPAPAISCHTTLIDGYVVEGHVPLEGLEQLITERPDIDGIALPGMPVGTPGMPGVKQGAFEVLALKDGQLEPYASF